MGDKNTEANSGLTLETYLRLNMPADVSLLSLARRSSNPTDSATLAANTNTQTNEDEWRENFETRLTASELQRGLSHSVAPYIRIAILTCAASSGVFLYFLTNYGVLDGPRGAKIPTGQAAIIETSAGYSDPDMTDQSQIDDARAVERPTRGEPSALIAHPASPSVSGSFPSVVGAARNQDVSAEGSVGWPAKAASESLPASQTSEASIPKSLSFSADAVPAEATRSPLQKSQTRVAALTPLSDAAQVKTAIPGQRDVPDVKPAAHEQSKPGTAVPDIHLSTLAPDQEGKMLKRASDLMNENDIAGARLIYQYLADHGSPSGALAFAESYDPNDWARHRITGMTPDASLAKAWYQRAAALGSKEAAAILREDKR
jgi:hypothetical protein